MVNTAFGSRGGRLEVLSPSEAEHIHAASLVLLRDCGIRSESDSILQVFRKAGVGVDARSRVIRVTPDLVETALGTAPKEFVLYS